MLLYLLLQCLLGSCARGKSQSSEPFLVVTPFIERPCTDLSTKYPRPYDQALIELSRVDVLVNSATELTLSATFKASLRQAITGGYAKVEWYLGSI